MQGRQGLWIWCGISQSVEKELLWRCGCGTGVPVLHSYLLLSIPTMQPFIIGDGRVGPPQQAHVCMRTAWRLAVC